MTEKRATLEIIAPTIDEAIEEGLEKLGLGDDEVEVEVLDEGNKGLFGLGSRQARIRLIVKDEAEEWDFESESPSPDDETEIEDLTNQPDEEDDQVLKIVRETVSELLSKMKVKAEVSAYHGEADDEHSRAPVMVDIHGKDLSILIGRKAETLNALQFITKLIIGKELEQSIPISLDVEGFRKRREQQIRQLARRVAEQVSKTQRSQALEPMPANERRIVHIELRDDSDVFTRSTDEGSRRKVVIYPKD
jgi:spoIIIJ-associated protein